MIHNYFWVIHITVEKIIISQHMASRGGPLKVLTSGIYRGPSGESQGTNTKIDDFMKKLFFRSNSSCITYLFLLFTEITNIQKF